jgi:Flp pilus assembly protein TadB
MSNYTRETSETPPERKDWGFVFVLSLVAPGLGHLAGGWRRRGSIVLSLWLVLALLTLVVWLFASVVTFGIFFVVGLFVVPFLHLLVSIPVALDARALAKQHNRELDGR